MIGSLLANKEDNMAEDKKKPVKEAEEKADSAKVAEEQPIEQKGPVQIEKSIDLRDRRLSKKALRRDETDVVDEAKVPEPEPEVKEESPVQAVIEKEAPSYDRGAEWLPKTDLGKKVIKGEYETIEDLLRTGQLILEPQIVDYMVPDLKNEVIYIGGSPGKGGGIRRTATKRTVRMHKSGRRFKLSSVIVAGNERSVVGIGKASSREHKTAIEKALENSKLNLIIVKKGCGSWECGCGGDHSIPFQTEAKCGSVKVKLIPAPKGLGIVASDPLKKVLKLAGIQDIWVKASGNTHARANLVHAVFEALRNLNKTKGDL
jgi:small subunit ribosomal protein S5